MLVQSTFYLDAANTCLISLDRVGTGRGLVILILLFFLVSSYKKRKKLLKQHEEVPAALKQNELKQAQKDLYNILFRTLQECIVTLKPDGRVSLMNFQALKELHLPGNPDTASYAGKHYSAFFRILYGN